MAYSWEKPRQKNRKKKVDNIAQLDYFEYRELIKGKNPLTDSKLQKMMRLPDFTDRQKELLKKKSKKEMVKKTGFPEEDKILKCTISEDVKLRFDTINYFNHLGHHIRIERHDEYFSIVCTTCGHDEYNNHCGKEINRIYPDDQKFLQLFERKKNKKKRYYYYYCKFCECKISMMNTSDKWILKECPICGSTHIEKKRDTELYDYTAVTIYSEFLQLKHSVKYMEMKFSQTYKDMYPLFKKDRNHNPILTYSIKTHNPYITKDDYIKEMHRRRPTLILKDDHILTDPELIAKLPKTSWKSNYTRDDDPIMKTQTRENFDVFE